MHYLKRLYLNEYNVVVIAGFWRGKVITAGGEMVESFLNDVLVVEVGKDGHQEPPVPVVCHTAAIVTLPSQVSYGLEGHLIIVIHKQLKRKEMIKHFFLDVCDEDTWPLKL